MKTLINLPLALLAIVVQVTMIVLLFMPLLFLCAGMGSYSKTEKAADAIWRNYWRALCWLGSKADTLYGIA
jgi:hypothetical protein